jgi:histidinol dehydrogenase
MIRILPASAAGDLFVRKAVRLAEAENLVRDLIDDVRARGDAAVLEYARRFDGFDRASPLVSMEELERAEAALSPVLRKSIQTAAANIGAVANAQMPKPWTLEVAPGQRVGQVVRPLQTVCAYIPSGRYPLISTLLMTIIPAQVAGVPRICVTTPRAAPEILGAAALLEQRNVYLLGGAHAIAAFALGTETVPRADRIVGPGNIYVAAAKKLLQGEVGIDFVAGPTEIVIIAREGNPGWIAADMLAQAEHDVEASAVLLTTSRTLGQKTAAEIERQLTLLPTADVARVAIEKNSAVIIVDSIEQAIEWSNRLAPEHVALDDAGLVEKIEHAGAIFVGPHSPEAAGDYASGSNHVLPTARAARLRGGLSTADFVKVISIQELSAEALQNLAPSITTLARAEGLEGHARSVEARADG